MPELTREKLVAELGACQQQANQAKQLSEHYDLQYKKAVGAATAVSALLKFMDAPSEAATPKKEGKKDG